jgi:hypothetical protein
MTKEGKEIVYKKIELSGVKQYFSMIFPLDYKTWKKGLILVYFSSSFGYKMNRHSQFNLR